ncbi:MULTISPECIES: LuxR C-terminal-related transcriptional regulator [Legionella]|uniref:LuxR family transcriptional regulator n=1 Tax=Legionella steelei TaxID=947033 RepID=A0A0W0ZFB2_9GAMM|nr:MULTISPECIES: LuxR C-terminal-related transcriptional regulator [Legionella]KTD67721.1 LuxR family transcriptional regulator [Legionella steelei]MBN9228438.1 PAS domain-containing protein [Legionella steelei]OJW09041.1 MAG: helix-turn-helix transcriptional regulator [Legionella sp. 39-23]
MITRKLAHYMYAEASLTTGLDNILDTTLANIYVKDKKGCYLDCNHNMLHVNKMQDMKGKMDYDLLWKEQAPLLMKNDAEIIQQNKAKTFLETVQLDGSIQHYLSRKAPLYTRQGKIIGVVGISFLIDGDTPLFSTMHETALVAKPNANVHFNPSLLPEQNANGQLTTKQVKCLYYLVKGMTIKQIGQKLNLSPRTVEDHLNAAKNKLNCYNRAELIAAALQLPIIRNQL